MPILHSSVSKYKTVLANHSTCQGNFSEIVERILEKIPLGNGKRTYCHGRYLLHYVIENTCVYLCITDKTCQRSRAFLFLNEIKRKFSQNSKCDINKILVEEMNRYSDDQSNIIIRNGELDEINNISVESSEQLLGEEILIVRYNPQETLHHTNISSLNSESPQQSAIWKDGSKLLKFACSAIVLFGLLIFIVNSMCTLSTPVMLVLFICFFSKLKKKVND